MRRSRIAACSKLPSNRDWMDVAFVKWDQDILGGDHPCNFRVRMVRRADRSDDYAYRLVKIG
jgi:hypothetical protein